MPYCTIIKFYCAIIDHILIMFLQEDNEVSLSYCV